MFQMKRFITVLSSLLLLPAFAEVAPVYYDDVIEYSDDMIDDEEIVAEEAQTPAKNVNTPKVINRSTSATRAISSAAQSGASRTNTSTRAIATSPRSTTSGTNRGTVSRTAKTNAVVSRASNAASRATVTARNTKTTKATTARVGTSNNSVMPAYTVGTRNGSSAATLNDSGNPLYISNTARVGVTRRATSRASLPASTETTPVITQEDITSTTNTLTALAELTDYCKAQYAACMDNYCNVLDDNEGRCSCSKNLKNYAKTEEALAKATSDFQEVVQKIKYIGLSSTQIEALFAETEAEISMKSNTDNSRLKSNLDAIKKKIVDVSSPTASAYDATNGISLDVTGLLNADFTSGFDLNSFLGIATASNTSNVSNQRGEQLFKTATNRCKTAVLNSCVAQGIDANVITNSYDLEIDKQCMAYERNLNEANTEMRNNVANATNILQQARLLLTQNKNSYDLRGCISAIDACMQDEFVCGDDYELCLDPTGKYLANGEIVKGGTPGVAGGQVKNTADYNPTTAGWLSNGMYNLYAVWNYNNDTKNAWSVSKDENLGGYIDEALTDWKSNYSKTTTITENMARYLLQKIGYIDSKDNDKVHGMCASVMKQCQDYTFDSQKTNKRYIPNNEVVRQYLSATLAKIKVKQDTILADYAANCRSDVQSCLSTNGYDEANPSSTGSKTAVNSCSSEITTCMSVGGYQVQDGVKLTLRAMSDWVASMLINCPANTYLYDDGIGNGTMYGKTTQPGSKIECKACEAVSLRDRYGEIITGQGAAVIPTYSNGGQVTRCTCTEGYYDYVQLNEDGRYELMGCISEASSN